MIESVERHETREGKMAYVVTMNGGWDTLLQRYMASEIPRAIIERLAVRFVEDHGDEILKRINEKVIDSKVIAKVVENLRKELRKA
jgi:hypothetical protein